MRNLSFMTIDSACRDFALVSKLFEDLIVPLYGDQTVALEKIKTGTDRLCEVLYDGSDPKGLIVYKKAAENNTLEIKTLCLFHPERDSGKGYGTALFR